VVNKMWPLPRRKTKLPPAQPVRKIVKSGAACHFRAVFRFLRRPPRHRPPRRPGQR
jgi:hypothetical protein